LQNGSLFHRRSHLFSVSSSLTLLCFQKNLDVIQEEVLCLKNLLDPGLLSLFHNMLLCWLGLEFYISVIVAYYVFSISVFSALIFPPTSFFSQRFLPLLRTPFDCFRFFEVNFQERKLSFEKNFAANIIKLSTFSLFLYCTQTISQ